MSILSVAVSTRITVRAFGMLDKTMRQVGRRLDEAIFGHL